MSTFATNRVRFLAVLVAIAAIALLIAVPAVFADVAVTAATGGDAISADTTAGAAGEAFTDLDPITIVESANTEFESNVADVTLILNVPDGFEFGQTPDINAANGDVTALGIASTSTTITVTYTTDDTDDTTDTIIIGGGGTAIQVRPTIGTVTTGQILRDAGSTSNITGINEATNFGTLTIVPGLLDNFLVEAQDGGDIAAQVAGVAFEIQVTARDQFSNTLNSGTNDFNGADNTVVISSNVTGSAGLTVTVGFTNGLLNNHSVTLTESTGAATITALDSGTGLGTGAETGISGGFVVDPAPLDNFLVEAEGGGDIAAQVAGVPFEIQVTARDEFNNTLNSGTNDFDGAGNTVDITSNVIGSAGLTVTATFTNGVLASHAVTLTQTSATADITATDTDSAGLGTGAETGTSAPFAVDVAAEAAYTVVTENAGTEVAGISFSVTITAVDAFGNVVTAVTGGRQVDWTTLATASPSGVLPTLADDGTQTFAGGSATALGFILTDAGETPTITATTPAGSTGESDPITVDPGDVTQMTVEPLDGGGDPTTTVIAGVAFSVRITVQDQFQNTADNFLDDAVNVTWTTTAGAAPDGTPVILPGDSTIDLTVVDGVLDVAGFTLNQVGSGFAISGALDANDDGTFGDPVGATPSAALFVEGINLDAANYKTGDTVNVTLGDQDENDVPGAAELVVVGAASTTIADFPITVTLTETDLATGLFSGQFLLVATNPAAGEVVASTGDTITVTYPAKAASFEASDLNEALVDDESPTVAVVVDGDQDDPTNDASIDFTVTFNADVSGFTNDEVTIGGTAGANVAVVTGGDDIYNVAVSGMATDGTVTVSIGAGVAQDAAGNSNTASPGDPVSVTYDVTGPKATINRAVGQGDPTNEDSIDFTVVFDEDIDATSFVGADDVTLSGDAGATTAVVTTTVDFTEFNVAVSGMDADGTVTAAIGVGVVTDLAGNPNEAATSTDNTVTRDTTNPILDVADIVGTTVQGSGDTIVLTFSENIAAVDEAFSANEFTAIESPDDSALDLTNAAFVVAGNVLTITLDEATDGAFLVNGDIVAVTAATDAITDLAGNSLADEEVVGTTDNAGDVALPTVGLTYDPDRAVRDADTLTITAQFSEAMTEAPQISIVDADTAEIQAAAGMSIGADNTIWTFVFDVPDGSDGAAAVTLTGVDLAGNDSEAATNATFVIDNTVPTDPTDLVATATPGVTTLTWTASTDAESAVAEYRVFRSTSDVDLTTAEGGDFDLIETVAGDTLTFGDTDPIGDGEGEEPIYRAYLVDAIDEAGNGSNASNVASAIRLPGLPDDILVTFSDDNPVAGAEAVTVTGSVVDAVGNSVAAGATVGFTTSAGVLVTTTDVTDENGVTSVVLNLPTDAGEITVTATTLVDGEPVTNSGTFEILPAGVANVTIVAAPTAIDRDGVSQTTLTVTLVDVSGNTVPTSGTTIVLVTTAGTLGATDDLTVDGVFSTTLTSDTTSVSALVEASAGGVFEDTVTVGFTAIVPDPDPELPAGDVALDEGFNLMSLPLIPNDSAIEVVLADIIDLVNVVWYYDAVTQTWLSFTPGAPSDLTEMVDGRGYWIDMSAAAVLTVEGVVQPDPPNLPPTYDVLAGWNLVGFKSTVAMAPATYLTAVNDDVVVVIGFDEGAFFGVLPSDAPPNLTPGLGYWVFMANDGTIVPPLS